MQEQKQLEDRDSDWENFLDFDRKANRTAVKRQQKRVTVRVIEKSEEKRALISIHNT